jgi:hypothetical protein
LLLACQAGLSEHQCLHNCFSTADSSFWVRPGDPLCWAFPADNKPCRCVLRLLVQQLPATL